MAPRLEGALPLCLCPAQLRIHVSGCGRYCHGWDQAWKWRFQGLSVRSSLKQAICGVQVAAEMQPKVVFDWAQAADAEGGFGIWRCSLLLSTRAGGRGFTCWSGPLPNPLWHQQKDFSLLLPPLSLWLPCWGKIKAVLSHSVQNFTSLELKCAALLDVTCYFHHLTYEILSKYSGLCPLSLKWCASFALFIWRAGD